MFNSKRRIDSQAFTIVELLIVIVIIGILAAITIVSYSGIRERAVSSSLESSLSQAVRKVEMFYADNSYYPDNLVDIKALNIKFPFSPVATNALFCSDKDGYAIFIREKSGAKDGYAYITNKGLISTSVNWPSSSSTDGYWSATMLCPYSGFTSKGWGSYWVYGG